MSAMRMTDSGDAWLLRLVMLLLSLAETAEHAAGRSLAVRIRVCGLLRPAELAALSLFDDVPGRSGMILATAHVQPQAAQDELLRLAAAFRILAAFLAQAWCGGYGAAGEHDHAIPRLAGPAPLSSDSGGALARCIDSS